MATIVIENLFGKVIQVADLSKTLLKHLHDNGVDWMHACGGKGRCTTCKVIIASGQACFSEPSPAEIQYRRLGALAPKERLSCQSKISGDVAIAAPKEYQLPHVRYSAGGS